MKHKQCLKDLRTYLDENHVDNLSMSRFCSVFSSSIFQKLSAFVEKIVKCSSYPLYSENYFFSSSFDTEGCAWIEGVMWSQICGNYDSPMSSDSQTEDKESDILTKIDSTFNTAVTVCDIKDKYKWTDAESLLFSNLVIKHQFDLENKPEFPSLETMLTVIPEEEAASNITDDTNKLIQRER